MGTRGTILTVSHFHIFSYKLSKGKLSQFNPILEQFGRPRSRVTQECGELCQLRWSNQYFQLIFIHTSLRSILPRKMHGKPSVSTEKPCTGLCLLRKQGKAPPDPALDKVLFHFSIFPEILLLLWTRCLFTFWPNERFFEFLNFIFLVEINFFPADEQAKAKWTI